MTALNCYVTADAAHLITDGALYAADDGAISAISSKVIHAPHLNCVFGYSGTMYAGEAARLVLIQFNPASFDDLAEKASQHFKDIAAMTATLPNWPRSFDGVEIVLAGWSGRAAAPAAFLFRGGPHHGSPSWVAHQITRHQMPLVDPVFKLDPADPAQSARRLIDAQRIQKCHPTMSGSTHLEIYGVGGFAQHTEVMENQISTSVIRRWADPVGKPINPFSEANGYRSAFQ